ncbi:hypothetical protein BDF14DRAFT_1395863 [Spinellus fusiger]|nr:hypothetical protein BDF14DRAFT_1395863 [Spinellus fusiger]
MHPPTFSDGIVSAELADTEFKRISSCNNISRPHYLFLGKRLYEHGTTTIEKDRVSSSEPDNVVLSSLPTNYDMVFIDKEESTLFHHIRGHPSGKYFHCVEDFLPHLIWLSTYHSSGDSCICCLCSTMDNSCKPHIISESCESPTINSQPTSEPVPFSTSKLNDNHVSLKTDSLIETGPRDELIPTIPAYSKTQSKIQKKHFQQCRFVKRVSGLNTAIRPMPRGINIPIVQLPTLLYIPKNKSLSAKISAE